MTLAYFEMIGGASGNMLLGALADAGADLEAVERALRTIPVRKPWRLCNERVVKRGVAATYVSIEVPGEDGAGNHVHHEPGKHAGIRLADVLAALEASALDEPAKRRAGAIYTRLGEAEALVHGEAPAEVHFHEVGETDAILDVAGTCVALDLLAVDEVRCSPFPIGRGTISMTHGTYPNPPPATAALLRGLPTYDGGEPAEMVTTTGAAILSTLTQGTARPAMIADRIGYGAGSSEFAIPNVLRVSIGPATEDAAGTPAEVGQIAVLETNVDDMSPQHFELAVERTFEAGALDVWLISIGMKKSRPGLMLCAVAPLDRERACVETMLRETTSLGVRVRHDLRYAVERRVDSVATKHGTVRVKTATVFGRQRRTIEYDDVLRIARAQRRPIAEVARDLEKELPP